MQCPLCDERLREVERYGVTIDICPSCKGGMVGQAVSWRRSRAWKNEGSSTGTTTGKTVATATATTTTTIRVAGAKERGSFLSDLDGGFRRVTSPARPS